MNVKVLTVMNVQISPNDVQSQTFTKHDDCTKFISNVLPLRLLQVGLALFPGKAPPFMLLLALALSRGLARRLGLGRGVVLSILAVRVALTTLSLAGSTIPHLPLLPLLLTVSVAVTVAVAQPPPSPLPPSCCRPPSPSSSPPKSSLLLSQADSWTQASALLIMIQMPFDH
eukprot:3933461-Rhodomonas_salina.1